MQTAQPHAPLPPVSVLHRALLGLAIPPADATVTLTGPLLPQDTAPLRYACQVRRLTPTADVEAEAESEEDPLGEWLRRVQAWGGGVVTKGTRVVVRGQACTVVDPTRQAWAAAAVGVGVHEDEEEEEKDLVFGDLLAQLCLRLRVGTAGGSSGRSDDGGCHAIVIEGSPGSGKTSLVGAAARRLGLPAVVVLPGELMARFDVEADSALEAAAAAARALAPAVLLVDNADLLCGWGASGGQRAGRLLAASRGEVDLAVGRWLARALESADEAVGGAGAGVALVLTVRDGWQLGGGGGGGGSEHAPRLRMAAAAVGPAAARAVLRWELRGSSLLPPEGEGEEGGRVLDAAARGCQGFALGEVAAVARKALVLCSSSSSPSSASAPAALEAALAEVRTRRLTTGAGLPALGRVDPPMTWEDVGGLRAAKAAVQEMVTWPMAHAAAFARLGIAPPTGLLLYGPPGTGKTLIAKAAACQVRKQERRATHWTGVHFH